MIESTRIFGGRRISAFAWRKSFAGAILSIAFLFVAAGVASAETRTLKLYFIHTKERAEITYKRDGRYIGSGLDKINRFLRDWRRNEPTKMDPRLLDLVWEVYQKVGARDYINVVSAYRSPATNSMLRSRSNGVAKSSQHMLGKAMDFFIPGVRLSTLRGTALKMQGGGVGYYPASGSPFVHLDVGSVRHWPRMRRDELMALFPDGRTMHVPTDGKPLAGYNQAVAAYNSNKSSRGRVQIASTDASSSKPRRGLLAALFGGGADEEEDTADNGQPAPAIQRTVQPVVAAVAAAPVPSAELAAPSPETVLAALPVGAVPLPRYAQRPLVDIGQPLALAESLYSRPQGAEAATAAALAPLTADTVEVALNIPVPTPRPAYVPAPIDDAVQVADASASGGLPLPGVAPRADFQTDTEAQPAPSATVAAYLPMPSTRPGDENTREYVLASLPEAGPSYGAPPISTDPLDATGGREDRTRNTDGRLARLAAAPTASPRLAMLQSSDGQSLATGVKTTTKGAKPGPADTKPDPRAVLVPIPQQVARWALDPKPTSMEKRGTRAPSFAQDIVRTAPQMVYTAGFQSENGQAQPNRFTGKAVTFLTVARFTRSN